MLGAALLMCAATSGLVVQPQQARLAASASAPARSSTIVAAVYKNGEEMTKESFSDDFGGCLSGEPLGWKGALLATAGTYLWYLGTNTNTNAERQLVEGPGVRRRNILLVVLLQIGAANFRSGTGRVCTDEERKEVNLRKLERKGFSRDKINF